MVLAIAASLAAVVAIFRLRPRPWLVAGSLARHLVALTVVLAWVHLASILPMTRETHRWTGVAFAAAGFLVLASLPFAVPGRRPFGRQGWSGGKVERAALAALLCVLFVGTLTTAALFIPGSYALTWPTLLVALAAFFRRPRRRMLALAVAAALSTLILLPLAWLVTVAMTLRLLAAGAAILMLIAWIWRPALSCLLVPRGPITVTCVLASLALFALVFLA
jgi:hypothetical protein